VAALIPNMFYNFSLVKFFIIANNSSIFRAREKIKTDLESLKFYKFVGVGLTKFENNQIYSIKVATDI
jgi:hypothetical protein